MSTAPENWQAPKTSYDFNDMVLESDFERIETNINSIDLGNRTLDPSVAPSGNTANLRELLDHLAHQIGKLIGGHWYNTILHDTLNTFWFSGSLLPGTVIPASPGHFQFASLYTRVPAGKIMVLSRVRYIHDSVVPTTGPDGPEFLIMGTDANGVVFSYTIARPAESNEYYRGDINPETTVVTNNTQNDIFITLRLRLYNDGSQFTISNAVSGSIIQALFDIRDI
jgi:hypothetical protein